MRVLTAGDADTVNVDNIARSEIAADNKVARVRQRLARNAKTDGLRNIAGGNQMSKNLAGAWGAINIHWPIPVGHHVQAKAGKEAANMVEMMMRDEQFVHGVKINTRAFKLLKRAFSAVHQNCPTFVGNSVRRRHAMWLGRGAASGAERNECRVPNGFDPLEECRD